ncbi:MAG: LytTR family DNA-binding domain-containing protein [Acidobacteria bacterium]|nr:LytTR family DNA-binding domain-containing protein [Acidobacteriota bacterium]
MTEQPARSIRAVVVDDEALSRALILEYLAEHPDVEVVGECANGFEAVRAVTELGPDLLFLDVQMPKLDGFEVLELVGADVDVIFVTAYDTYALRAFEVHAVDYLLKPFGAGRFAAALDEARARLARAERAPVSQVVASARPAGHRERILIRSGAKVEVVPVGRVDYILARDDYVGVVVGGRELLKQQTLADLAGQLDPERFVRIHRSCVLNLDRLARLDRATRDSHVAVLKDGTELPVSRSGYARLNELL